MLKSTTKLNKPLIASLKKNEWKLVNWERKAGKANAAIPAIARRVTTMAEHQSHHWRVSMPRTMAPTCSSGEGVELIELLLSMSFVAPGIRVADRNFPQDYQWTRLQQ